MAALFARDHPAECAVVLPFRFASSLRRETRLQDWTHRYALSYRDLEEMMAERGVEVDHSTINRWVLQYAPELDNLIQPHLKPTNDSCRVDETYIKVKGLGSSNRLPCYPPFQNRACQVTSTRLLNNTAVVISTIRPIF